MTQPFRAGRSDDAGAMLTILEASLAAEEASGAIRHRFADRAREIAWLRYLLDDPAGASWVAEEGGATVGFGITVQRGSISWLAYLFVLPAHQGRGLGRGLLARLWPPNAEVRATLVDASSRAAFGLYLSLGLLPRSSVHALEGQPRALGSMTASVRVSADADGPDGRTDALDSDLFGASRPADHHEWTKLGLAYRSLERPSGEWLGYARWTPEGRLGPVALAAHDVWGDALIEVTRAMGASGIDSVRYLAPAENASAIRWAVEHGLHYRGMEVLLSTSSVGDWGRYLIHRAALP